jgi:hypothetical protein
MNVHEAAKSLKDSPSVVCAPCGNGRWPHARVGLGPGNAQARGGSGVSRRSLLAGSKSTAKGLPVSFELTTRTTLHANAMRGGDSEPFSRIGRVADRTYRAVTSNQY